MHPFGYYKWDTLAFIPFHSFKENEDPSAGVAEKVEVTHVTIAPNDCTSSTSKTTMQFPSLDVSIHYQSNLLSGSTRSTSLRMRCVLVSMRNFLILHNCSVHFASTTQEVHSPSLPQQLQALPKCVKIQH